MFKNLIAPVQAWLLAKGQCVGCGSQLSNGKSIKYDDNRDQVTCSCRRIFIYNKNTKKYRRALIEEVK